MHINETLQYTGSLSAVIFDEKGRPIASENFGNRTLVHRPKSFLRKLWDDLRSARILPAALATSFGTFALWTLHNNPLDLVASLPVAGLVTQAGVNYLATIGNPLSNFNYHDMGTGTLSHGSATQTINSAANVSGTIQVTFASAHGATTNDIWQISGVTGSGISSGQYWQVTVISSTILALVGSAGSGSYTASSATGQLVNGAGDTALTTAAGTSRVNGSQSNPGSVNQYQTVATITNNTAGSLTISEWGLFSASTAGTLWDRRWLNSGNSPQTTATGALSVLTTGLNVNNSVQWTYTVTLNQGGS